MMLLSVAHRYLPELLQGHIGHRCIQPVSDPLRLSFGLNYSDGKRGTAIDLAYSIFVDEVMDGDDGPVAPGERTGLEQYTEFTHGSRFPERFVPQGMSSPRVLLLVRQALDGIDSPLECK